MASTSPSNPATSAGASHVHKLDGTESLDKLLRIHRMVLLSITHRLSPHSQKFSPVFEEVAKALSTSTLEVECAQVECFRSPDLALRFGVRAYPTVVLCYASGEFKICHGGSGSALKKDAILAFLRRESMPAVILDIDTEKFKEIRATNDTVIVAYIDSHDVLVQEWFATIANEMRDDFVFCTSSDHRLLADEEVNTPSIVVYKTVAEEKSILRDVQSEESIRNFLKLAVRPLVMEFLPELQTNMLEGGIPLGYILISSLLQQQQAINDFLPLAREHQGQIQFGTVNVNDFKDLAEKMHIGTNHQWPAFAIHDPISNLKYPLTTTPDSRAFEIEEASIFIQDFLAGTLKPTIKSAPLPTSQPSPLTEIVGLSYASIVLDPSKDVFVEFYTPWCGPCKALLPAYEKLASLYASDPKARDLVMIAKIDFEANDVPDMDVRGFPWFKLYPAGKKGSPVVYKGERSVEAWGRFIEVEGSHGVVLDLEGKS